jgi:16S rRNA G527 N7-methylase RsmG
VTAAVVRLLRDAARSWDYDDESPRVAALAEYVVWAAPGAARLGLTQYADPLTFARQLVLPALKLAVPAVRGFLRSPILDFGAGSGAMGLSLGVLFPYIEVTIADRRRRVTRYADVCCARLGLPNCQSRLLDLLEAPTHPDDVFSVVLVRAFGPTDEALRAAAPWTAPGGAIALWHRPPAPSLAGLRLAEKLDTGVPALQLAVYERKPTECP